MSDPLRPGDSAPPPVPDVWPPPPSGLPPSLHSPVWGPPALAPLRGLATALTALLAVYAAVALGGLAAAFLPPTEREIGEGLVALLHLGLLAATGVCFLVWTYRLVANLPTLGISGLKHTPAWAVGYFFVPILNLYRPYQIFREIWQGSTPKASGIRDLRTLPVPPLLGFWWFSWLLTSVLGNLAARSNGDQNVDLLHETVSVVSALLALWVVRRFTARQEAAARALGV